jgi:cardiolipin synthase
VFDYISLPNIITGLRIVAAPFLYIFIQRHLWLQALILCLLCGLTDYLDGFLARLMAQTSSFGEIFDPLADKIFIFFLYIALYMQNRLPFYLLGTIFLRDILLIIGSIFVLKNHAEIPLGPLWMSKINTFFQIFLCLWVLCKEAFKGFYIQPLLADSCTTLLIYVTLMTTVFSGLQYARRFIQFYS